MLMARLLYTKNLERIRILCDIHVNIARYCNNEKLFSDESILYIRINIINVYYRTFSAFNDWSYLIVLLIITIFDENVIKIDMFPIHLFLVFFRYSINQVYILRNTISAIKFTRIYVILFFYSIFSNIS